MHSPRAYFRFALLVAIGATCTSAEVPSDSHGLKEEGINRVAKALIPSPAIAPSDTPSAAKQVRPIGGALSNEEIDVALRPFREYTKMSADFRRELATGAGSIPSGVWQRLKGAGWKFGAARLVVDAAPWLSGRYPRGWPAGSTWENTDAVHLPGNRLLLIGEKRVNKQGKLVVATRVEEVVRHEIGHAFDAAIGANDGYRSSSSAFLLAYRRDAAAMDAADRERLAYYLQNQQAGRQETFAEAFAEIHGGGSSPERADVFRRAFPLVFEEVRAALKECE